jgi:glutathione S-transferase
VRTMGQSQSQKANVASNRYALNIKGLPYTTKWVEYPDIETVCKQIGAPATGTKPDDPTQEHYTMPVIVDPNTKAVIVDSDKIAKYLDVQYPSTLQLFAPGTDALQAAFHDFMWAPQGLGISLFMLVIAVTTASLNPPSQAYFRATREKWFGAKIEALASEEHWKKLEGELAKVEKYLRANGHGKDMLIGGDTISYSDVQLAAAFKWARVVCGEDSQEWKRLMNLHGGKWAKYYGQFTKFEQTH